MTTMRLPAEAEHYLEQLRDAAGALPADRRRELVADIEAHLHEAVTSDPGEAGLRDALDRLGSPEAIVAAERAELGPQPPAPSTTREWLTVGGLLLGGVIVPFLGWIFAVAMLWSSRVWSRNSKLLGTFVLPGGWLAAVVVFSLSIHGESCSESSDAAGNITRSVCTGQWSTLHEVLVLGLLGACIVAPLMTAIVLLRRANRP